MDNYPDENENCKPLKQRVPYTDLSCFKLELSNHKQIHSLIRSPNKMGTRTHTIITCYFSIS